MKNFGVVYIIENEKSGMKYVGATKLTLGRRWSRHVIKSRKMGKSPLWSAIREDGEGSFTISALAYADSQDQLDLLESMYIVTLGTLYPNGYNLQSGARKGFKHHQISKDHLREVFKGRSLSDESKKKLSASLMGKNAGKVRSPEHRAAVGNAHRGKPKSFEQRQKMSLAAKNASPEVRARRVAGIRAAIARKKQQQLY